MLKTAGQVYEFIGPASLLTEAQLADFTTFGEDECMIAQLSPISMADAQNKYTDYYASNATNIRPSMGAYKVPITVAITIPVSTQDFSSIGENTDIYTEVMAEYGGVNTESVTYGEHTCIVKTLNMVGSYAPVRYVFNGALASDVTEPTYDAKSDLINYSVGAWERDIALSHNTFLSGNDSMTWDRYLDTHVGFQYTQYNSVVDEQYCSDQSDAIWNTVLAHNQPFSLKTIPDVAQHFYTGSEGLKSIEYNLILCVVQELVGDVCGCNSINNSEGYAQNMNLTCDGSSTKDWSTYQTQYA
jgi:hypothetical protein